MLKLALAAAAAVVAVLALFYLLQDRLIFYPRPLAEAERLRVAQRHPEARGVFLEAADGTRLHAWHVAAAPGAPLVLYFGGNAEEVSWMLGVAPSRAPGTGWLLIDYRGYGASAGRPSERALVEDAVRWHGYAREALGNPPIVLFGRSLGSGVAVQLAAARPVAGVILIAPFDSLVELGRHYYPFLPLRWMLRHGFESAAAARRVDAPLLCLVAERDEVVPLVRSKRLYEAWSGPKRWVALAGARHNSTDDAPAFWREIRDFLKNKHAIAGTS
ncbi:MAG TPA: alpha/beta hydrolase [Burkholderiales bacterium]|nr:alpha/beta hydrolase [Burkholderiales bacterium]